MKPNLLSATCGLLLITASVSAGMIELKTDIPPAEISGTPVPINLTNLEPLQQTAPTLKVPEGTVLLSADKPVTSSDDWPLIGDVEYLTDGDKETGEGYYVELIPGLQWVQIDLEQEATIEAIWLWHYHAQQRAYHDVVVQLSNDPEFAADVTTVFNNDFDNSAGFGVGPDLPYIETNYGKLIDVKSVSARYVRFYANGSTSNDANHYIEAEVWGVPAN
ncbi:MAG: discoidin domain-containing protein [Puniceicoccaceae bacterium]